MVYIYIEQWFAAPLPTQAPLNDLTFYKKLVQYSTVDRGISDAAVKAFKGHLWYLTEDLICPSLFDNRVSFEQKDLMADNLKKHIPLYIENQKKRDGLAMASQ